MKTVFHFPQKQFLRVLIISFSICFEITVNSAEIDTRSGVEGQPLAANVFRVMQALDFLGAPIMTESEIERLNEAARERDSERIQELLDRHVLFMVEINPEVRIKVSRGPGSTVIQQGAFKPLLIKVLNQSTSTQQLNISSPQSGPSYAGVARLSMDRQQQQHLRENENVSGRTDRFLELEMYHQPPMTRNLSGLEIEYAIALIFSSEAGKREATIGFDMGEGTQDLGFRGELPVLFDIQRAVAVALSIEDHDGSAATGRFLFLDRLGHVYPPQARRLAPDLFFQKQIYRHDEEVVFLPPGELTMYYGRGPEYRWLRRSITIPAKPEHRLKVRLQRWINPMNYGFYGGDHHIHAAGCAHYQSPTQGVLAKDMFRQVAGEGLNVGCILTWGPGFDFQKNFFASKIDPVSQPLTVVKYDIEVSGFGSQALGHVCLLNLQEQIYPGANGSSGWPTWTTPVLRWAKSQGAVTGYAHSGSGLQVNPSAAAGRLIAGLDRNIDSLISNMESENGLLPEDFKTADSNKNGSLSESELVASVDRAADRLPNFAIPELNSVGAQEIFVTTALGLCDFISAMDTSRLLEWNCWYHLINCGFPLKVSGETDFPCMSGTRVGQGRVYVQMGDVARVDFADWCRGLADGNSYVSDGYAHALHFSVNGKTAGETVSLPEPATVKIQAKVAFSLETPIEAAYGGVMPVGGMRLVGDTVNKHESSSPNGTVIQNTTRKVELVVNGRPVAAKEVTADNQEYDLEFEVEVNQSSWIALRHFPQMHTNPVNIILGGKPIRASRKSAEWCIECIEQLWRVRGQRIAPKERAVARKTFDRAIERYRKIALEAPSGS